MKSPSRKLVSIVRLAFVSVCGLALAALLLHPQAVSAAGSHVHTLAASDPKSNGAPLLPAQAPSSSTAAGEPGGSAARSVPGQQPGTPADAAGSGGAVPTPAPAPGGTAADGGSTAANGRQQSLGEAASQPNGQGLHPEAPNPAPVPRGTVAPSDVLDTASQSLGGCLKEYGDAGQCLPVVPPSLAEHLKEMKAAGLDPASMPHNWTCSEVRIYFPGGLTVRVPGTDPQKLDPNRNGVACDGAD